MKKFPDEVFCYDRERTSPLCHQDISTHATDCLLESSYSLRNMAAIMHTRHFILATSRVVLCILSYHQCQLKKILPG